MGNRAVITTSTRANVAESDELGVYLHWNGGRDSVNGFLTYCYLKGYPSPEKKTITDGRGCVRLSAISSAVRIALGSISAIILIVITAITACI